jgi:hypothetical protein
MPPTFDPDLYGSVPTRTPRATLGLARALISAAPEEPDAALAKRLTKIRKAAKLLQGAWVDASRPTPATEDARVVDVTLDRCWSAMRSRLEGCSQLGDDDLAPRATKLLETVFPTGLDFLRLPYAEEWAESERRLALIKTDDLDAEFERMAGAAYLPAIKQAHAAYGAALGITDKKAAAPDPARVLEPLRALQAAISSYVRAVVGAVDEDDEDSVVAAKEQLEPIVRARRPRASGGADADEPIEAPMPEGPGSEAAPKGL